MDGDLKNEGNGMLSVWALRARSYKTRADAKQQGKALHPLQGVFIVFVLLPDMGSRSSKGSMGSSPSNQLNPC